MALSVILFLSLLTWVGVTRLVELEISRRHRRNLARLHIGRRPDPQYPWMVALHASVLVAAAIEVVWLRRPFLPWLAAPCACVFCAGNGAALVGDWLFGRALERAGDGFGAVGSSGHRPVSLGAPSELPGSVCRNGGAAVDSYCLVYRDSCNDWEYLGVEKQATRGRTDAGGPSPIPRCDVRESAISAGTFLNAARSIVV